MDCSLLLHRNITDLYALYKTHKFLFLWKIMAYAYKNNLFSFLFQFWYFRYFSCLIALTRTSSTMWIEVMKASNLALFLALEGSASSFSTLSIGIFIYGLPWYNFLLLLVYWIFYHKRVWNFAKCFFLHQFTIF